MKLDDLHASLLKYLDGTLLLVEWPNGLNTVGQLVTAYETDNGLEMDNPEYAEYYACAYKINEIQPTASNQFSVGSVEELSIYNPPVSIKLLDGTVIWER